MASKHQEQAYVGTHIWHIRKTFKNKRIALVLMSPLQVHTAWCNRMAIEN